MTDIRWTPTRICQTRAWSDMGTNLHFFKDKRFTVDQIMLTIVPIQGNSSSKLCIFLWHLGIAQIGITINYSFYEEVHNKNMKTWALGIFYKCTNWLGWKSLFEIGVFSTLEVCTGRMVWMVWMHKHDCEQALQGSSIESRILVDPYSADISTERASNRSASANTNTIKNSYSNTYFHKKYLFVHKVNRCLARYSPRATTTNWPTNRAPKKPAWPGPYEPKMPILGQIWSFLGKKSFFLLEKS